MARPELGLKRVCPNCGTKYYDLNRDPITCPKCATVYQEAAITRVRPETAVPARPVPAEDEDVEDVADVADTDADEPELVSLEEAEDETVGAAKAIPGTEDDEELEIEEDLGEEFLEEDEDDADVSDLIEGDVEEDDEP